MYILTFEIKMKKKKPGHVKFTHLVRAIYQLHQVFCLQQRLQCAAYMLALSTITSYFS